METSTQTQAEQNGEWKSAESLAAGNSENVTQQKTRYAYDESVRPLIRQLRHIYGLASYNHKTHEKEADLLALTGKWVGYVQLALTALTTTSLLISVFGDKPAGTVVGAVLATLAFFLTALTQQMKYAEKEQSHIIIAKRYLACRDQLQSILTDVDCCDIPVDEIRLRRNAIDKEMQEIHKAASTSRTSPRAYDIAQKALKGSEELTFSEQELAALGAAGESAIKAKQ